MDITKLSLVELESLAYKQIVLLEQTKNNLATLNQQIAKLQSELKTETKSE